MYYIFNKQDVTVSKIKMHFCPYIKRCLNGAEAQLLYSPSTHKEVICLGGTAAAEI